MTSRILSIMIASALIGSVLVMASFESASASPFVTGGLGTLASDTGRDSQPTNGPSMVEHGYAGPDVLAAHADGAPVKRFTLIADEDHGGTLLPTTDRVHTMTFNGSIPAPTLRVTEGDLVQITIVNEGDEVHSIDQHASQITAVPNFGAVQPGENKTYTFVAANPGVFAYHCEAKDVFDLDKHALMGMEGMLIVDPKEGYEELETDSIEPYKIDENVESEEEEFEGKAKEFALTYSEYYYTDDRHEGHHDSGHDHPDKHMYDRVKMMKNDPTYTHENGIPFGYAGPVLALPEWQSKTLQDVIPAEFLLDCNVDVNSTVAPDICKDGDGDGTEENNVPLALTTLPGLQGTAVEGVFGNGSIATHIDVNAGDHARFFIQNTGDRQVSWHIVGEQLDRVTVGGNIMTESPVQTWNISPYQDAIVDVVFEQPGVYAAVNHDYSSLFKGQAAVIVAHAGIDQETCEEEVIDSALVCSVISGDASNVPSDVVPPVSDLEETSVDQSGLACEYGIGADQEWGTNDDNSFTTECDPL